MIASTRPAQRPIDMILGLLSGVKPTDDCKWMARCPAHGDKTPSLSVAEGDRGRVLLHCFAGCSFDKICVALDIDKRELLQADDRRVPASQHPRKPSDNRRSYPSMDDAVRAVTEQVNGKVVASWHYKDADDNEAFRIIRLKTPNGKTYRPISVNGKGWRVADPEGPLPLYRLPDLLDAGRVYVVEGEKVADALVEIGLIATTSAHGAGSAWKTDWKPLAGCEVVFMPDNNAAGARYETDVIGLLVRIAPPPKVKSVKLPGLPTGGDAVDYIEQRRKESLSDEEIRAEIETLADLPPITSEDELPNGSIPADCLPSRELSASIIPMETSDDPVISLEREDLPTIRPVAMPTWAINHALAVSQAKEVCISFATLLQLAVMASCVQRAFCVSVEPSYTEKLCIYVAPSLESGERKTAVHGPIVRPLMAYQKKLRSDAQSHLITARVGQRLIEQEIKMLEKKHLNSDEDQRRWIREQIIQLNNSLPAIKGLPQVIIEDFTEAALSVALEANRESLLVASDEGGLFDNLSGRHSDISEIDLFLKSHTGSPHVVNRIGRENLLLESPLLSVAISPQPAVLARLARKEGFVDRGLTARFLWALPGSKIGKRSLTPGSIGPPALQEYSCGIQGMAELGFKHEGDPNRLQLSPNAHAIWKSFERAIEPRLGRGGDLRHIKSWTSKLPGAVIRIAAVCHVGEHMSDAARAPISEDQMRNAVQMGKWLIPHSIAAHRLMGGGGVSVAQAVIDHYNAAGWPMQMQSLTEWWRPVRRIVGDTSRDFRPVAQILVDHGYLFQEEQSRRAGQWGQHYRANQHLRSRNGHDCGVES